MSNLRHDLLTIIQMKHDWITRKEIVQVLDMPGLEFTRRCVNMVATLERQGWIESRKVGKCWEYKAR